MCVHSDRREKIYKRRELKTAKYGPYDQFEFFLASLERDERSVLCIVMIDFIISLEHLQMCSGMTLNSDNEIQAKRKLKKFNKIIDKLIEFALIKKTPDGKSVELVMNNKIIEFIMIRER